MANRRYIIAETEPFRSYNGKNVRVFLLTDKMDWRPVLPIPVWYSGEVVACTCCSTTLRGMSSSCAHARAVKRHIQKKEDATDGEAKG